MPPTNYHYRFKHTHLILTFTLLMNSSGCMTWTPNETDILPTVNSKNGYLTANFFGTSTILFKDENHGIMIDAFLSRKSFLKYLTEGGIRSDKNLVRHYLSEGGVATEDIHAIFLSHSHFDHILDAAAISDMTTSKVYGSYLSLSTFESDRKQTIENNQIIKIGKFKVIALETDHVKKGFIARQVESVLNLLIRAQPFKEHGPVFSYYIEHQDLVMLIVPTAQFPIKITLPKKVDVVFLSMGLLGKLPETEILDYYEAAIKNSGARIIIPIHWDLFTKEIDKNFTATPYPFDNLRNSMKLLHKYAKENNLTICFPPPLKSFLIPISELQDAHCR